MRKSAKSVRPIPPKAKTAKDAQAWSVQDHEGRKRVAVLYKLGSLASMYPAGTIVKHKVKHHYYEINYFIPASPRRFLAALTETGDISKVGHEWAGSPDEYFPVPPDAPIYAIRKAARVRNKLEGKE
jgi:hypothetical protein